MVHSEGYDYSHNDSCGLCQTNRDLPGYMEQDDRNALGLQVDYDASRLTLEQRQSLLKRYLRNYLEAFVLKSPS